MKESAGDAGAKKAEKKQLVKMLGIMIVIIGLGVSLFFRFYNRYNDGVLYAERLNQMQEVTAQLFTGLEDVIKNQWKASAVQCNYLEKNKPETVEGLVTLLEEQMELSELDSQMDSIIAIDENGRYYTQEGPKGKLEEASYLLDKPEKVSFVTNSLIGDETRMLFLQRLSSPISLKDGERILQLIYCGVSYDMRELNPYFNCDAYQGNNCVYITDLNGLKLFRNSGGENLIQGYNIFSVLKNMEYLHGSEFETAMTELKEKKLSYSNAVLNGKEYYYALYGMDNSEWVVVFLVDSDYVATNTVSLVNATIKIILIFSIIMLIFCCTFIFAALQLKQRQVIAIEQKNAEELMKMNEILDQKNNELAHAVRAAEDASKAKTDFLANMSHDIRTPMNAIVGITSLMEHETGLTDKLMTYIQKVQLSSRHLLGLINDILDMSKIESNEVKLNIEDVSLAEQIGQIDSIIRASAAEHNQTFQIRVKEIAHEYLICDGVRLRQIFLNLLSNSVKYTQNGGNITFEITEIPCNMPDHAKFVYAVTDNGYGMTPEFVKHIFEPFTRAENSVTNKVQGTGLGMAITKNIVDLMGGTISVDSKIGKGTHFEVTLTLPINRKVDYEVGVERVLLVSSENQLIRNIKAAISQTNIQFYFVSTKEEAVGWLIQEKADVILLGSCLRRNDLPETVQLLRQTSKNTALIFGVDYVQEDHVQDFLVRSGMDGLVPRPFFMSNFAMTIAKTRTGSVSDEENETVLNGMRFLCAEDNELNAEILKELLDMYGASCDIYSNGVEIVEAFESVQPGMYDAILMDVQMPKKNGLEATKAIRNSKNPLGKTIPIIAMTANAFSEDVRHCISAGMDAHVAKPLDIAALEKTLRALTRGGGR